jgi:aminoglycoside phosphotransferase (APT) family kinase protein
VQREAAVYDALQRAGQLVPAFYGTYTEPNTDVVWLIIEHIHESSRLNRSLHPDPLSLGARWIGRFHADVAARCTDPSMAFLPTYDGEYYRGWAQRTLLGANCLPSSYTWLPMICGRYEESIDLLLAQPHTIIHGEYYPKNVLISRTTVYPIDWESAAVAAGEIDLATLTDRWPPEMVRRAEHAYVQARWPDGAPADFQQVLDAARLYVQFRWLGDPTTQQRQAWRFEDLHSLGQRLGLR